ncbi:heterokaryon incompatibility protein-domain-containing protein [Usnea florida]
MEPAPTSLNRLHYAQLDQNTKEIRLILLEHGEPGIDIKYRLIHTTLRNHPAYKALSYCWGEVKDLETIDIDGYVFSIGPNLKAALQNIRHPEESTYLWVDAICINQEDTAERNYQVPLMHEIYHQAVQVIVWLGKKSFDSDCAMDVLEDKDLSKRVDLFPPRRDISTAVIYTATAMATWEALSNFYTRSWWDRVWVIQEVVWAARDITVMCGSRELSWETLSQSSTPIHITATSSSNMTEPTIAGLGRASLVFQLTSWRARRIEALSFSFLDLLWQVRPRKSTDPRDKVFGILNLLPLEEWPCKPDYSKDVAQIFAEVARSIIEKHRSLSLLTTCEHPWLPIYGNSQQRNAFPFLKVPGLPSWAPNWTVLRQSVPLFPEGGHDATLETETFSRPTLFGEYATEFVFSDDMTTLSVRGFVADFVTISDGPIFGNQIEAYRRDLYKRLENIVFRVSRTKPWSPMYTGHMTKLEAYCRALVLDHPRTGCTFDSDALLQYVLWSIGFRDQLPDFLSTKILVKAYGGRFFFCSSKGYIGFGPQGTVPGDLLCYIYGCHVPIVLRMRPLVRGRTCAKHDEFQECLRSGCFHKIKSWKEIKLQFIVIGEAYVQGMMNGELMPENGLHPDTQMFDLC